MARMEGLNGIMIMTIMDSLINILTMKMGDISTIGTGQIKRILADLHM